ncbi:hypothetical protein MUN78_00385 [Leucobacter allii]|uniref:Uncharacterized protein n=1 Tax=Leucobacter allii TaxID=2932247 RepID=A0ABY4FM22_9MICO|nr:hypothetical protein [Leucobacter allii]UOQ57337.1 hypothetical protein MUN78_00385 [Leucobacter allii]
MNEETQPTRSEWDEEILHAGGRYTPTPATVARRLTEMQRDESAARVEKLRRRIADDLDEHPVPPREGETRAG